MKWLHSDIMTEKPMLKKLIILLVAVNAIVLAILLFGPSKESDASVRNTGSSGGNGQDTVVMNSSEESEDENSGEDRDSDDEDRNSDEEDRNVDEEEDRDDGEDSYGQDTEDSEENGGYAEDGDDEQEEDSDSWPKLELTDDHITLNVGEEFDYLKYIKTMEDRDGSSLSRYIHLSEVVNTWMPGEYTVTYTITSPIDGQSDSEDLHVTVE